MWSTFPSPKVVCTFPNYRVSSELRCTPGIPHHFCCKIGQFPLVCREIARRHGTDYLLKETRPREEDVLGEFVQKGCRMNDVRSIVFGATYRRPLSDLENRNHRPK